MYVQRCCRAGYSAYTHLGGNPDNWELGALRASTSLTRFVTMVTLDYTTPWVGSGPAAGNLHALLMVHFAQHLPHSCRCIDIHLVVPSPDEQTIDRNLAQLDWNRLGTTLRLLSVLDCVVFRLESAGGVVTPIWTLRRLELINDALRSYRGCSRKFHTCSAFGTRWESITHCSICSACRLARGHLLRDQQQLARPPHSLQTIPVSAPGP